MSIPSNERIASLALKIAHEVYKGGCIGCGAHGVEMHEILGRTMRPLLGATVAILGVTLAPLCAECHRRWENHTAEKQLQWLIYYDMDEYSKYSSELTKAKIDQLIALKARAAVWK